MNVIYGSPFDLNAEAIGSWFHSQTKSSVQPPFSAIGWADDEKLVGAALFNDFNQSNIEMHVWVIDNKMTKQMIRDVFEYVFVRSNCNRLTVKPYRKNKAAQEFAKRLGFVFEFPMKNYYGLGKGNDAMVYRLDRDIAESWLNGTIGHSTSAAAA